MKLLPYLKYGLDAICVSQSSTGNPVIVPVNNQINAEFTGEYVEVGQYSIDADKDLFETSFPPNKNLITTFGGYVEITVINERKIYIRAYDFDMNPSDDVLAENYILFH